MLRIRRALCVYTALIVTASCTIEQNGAHTEAEFHPPFTCPAWEMRTFTSPSGQTACVVTSGNNGYSVVVRNMPDGRVISVQSERFMPAGTWNVLTVNGHRYETKERYFSAKDAPAIANDFTQAEKAYAEWSELRGYNGRVRHTEIYKLAGFKDAFARCMK